MGSNCTTPFWGKVQNCNEPESGDLPVKNVVSFANKLAVVRMMVKSAPILDVDFFIFI